MMGQTGVQCKEAARNCQVVDGQVLVAMHRSVDVFGSKFVQVSFRSEKNREVVRVGALLFLGNQYMSLYALLEDFKKNYKDNKLMVHIVVAQDGVN